MSETEISKVKKPTLEERTLFQLFGSNKAEEPFLEIEYPRIIDLKVGDSVNIYAEKDSKEAQILGQNGFLMTRDWLYSPSCNYTVRKPKRFVNMSLSIGGECNPLHKIYELVRSKKSY